MKYKNIDTVDQDIVLQGCSANRIEYKDDVLSFIFPEGIWLVPSHPKNESNNTVRTNSARVDFHFPDEMGIYNMSVIDYRMFLDGELKGRVWWDVTEFFDAVNKGDFAVNIVEKFNSRDSVLLKCTLEYADGREDSLCDINIDVAGEEYFWNELRYNRVR